MVLLLRNEKKHSPADIEPFAGHKLNKHLKNTVMRKLTLKQQAKSLEINSVDELFYYFIDSYNYGNFTSCRRLFGELTKQAKKNVLSFLIKEGFTNEYNFYFELL